MSCNCLLFLSSSAKQILPAAIMCSSEPSLLFVFCSLSPNDLIPNLRNSKILFWDWIISVFSLMHSWWTPVVKLERDSQPDEIRTFSCAMRSKCWWRLSILCQPWFHSVHKNTAPLSQPTAWKGQLMCWRGHVATWSWSLTRSNFGQPHWLGQSTGMNIHSLRYIAFLALVSHSSHTHSYIR